MGRRVKKSKLKKAAVGNESRLAAAAKVKEDEEERKRCNTEKAARLVAKEEDEECQRVEEIKVAAAVVAGEEAQFIAANQANERQGTEVAVRLVAEEEEEEEHKARLATDKQERTRTRVRQAEEAARLERVRQQQQQQQQEQQQQQQEEATRLVAVEEEKQRKQKAADEAAARLVLVAEEQETAARLVVAVEEETTRKQEITEQELPLAQEQQQVRQQQQEEAARLAAVAVAVAVEEQERTLKLNEDTDENEVATTLTNNININSSINTSTNTSSTRTTIASNGNEGTADVAVSLAKRMKNMFDSTSSDGPSRAFSSNGSSARRNSGTSKSFNNTSTQKKAVINNISTNGSATLVAPRCDGDESENDNTEFGDRFSTHNDKLGTTTTTTTTTATEDKARNDDDVLEDGNDDDERSKLLVSSQQPTTTTTKTPSSTPPSTTSSSSSVAARMKQMFDSTSSNAPSLAFYSKNNTNKNKISRISHHHHHHHRQKKNILAPKPSYSPPVIVPVQQSTDIDNTTNDRNIPLLREPMKEQKAATEHQWEAGVEEETDRTGIRDSVLVKDDNEEMMIDDENALISSASEGIVATTVEIGGVDYCNGDQGDGDTESIIEEIIIIDDDEDRDDDDDDNHNDIIDGMSVATDGVDCNGDQGDCDNESIIEEIIIIDDDEDRDDNDHHDIDGMSVTTDGEFFETTARIEVSPEFVTTNNNTGDHNGDADDDQDGRSYDEFTAERSDWECDESTIGDDDDEFGDDDKNDIVVNVDAVENSANKDVGDESAGVLLDPSSKVGTVEHTQRDNRINEDDGKDRTAVAFVVATTKSIPTTPPSQKDATTASWCVAVGSTINSPPTVADFSRQDRRLSTIGKLGERLKMFDSPTTNSKSLNSCRTIPGVFTKQPSRRQEKSLLAFSKKDTTTTTTTTTTDTQSTQGKHIVNKQPRDLLVEQIVDMLNEPECMKNKKVLAQRIISLITSRSNNDNEGGNNDSETKMDIPATITPIDLSHFDLLATTTHSSRSRSRSYRRVNHSDSLDTTTHSSPSNRRGVLGSPKTTTTMEKSLTRREEEAPTYMCRKKNDCQDSGLKKVQNDTMVQKEKLRRGYDPDSISARKMKRVSIKDLKKKKEKQQQQQKESSSSFIQDIKIDSELRSNEEKPPLIANSSSSPVATVDNESIMARIRPKDKVQLQSKHHHARTTTTAIEKTPSTKKLGERLKLFQSSLPRSPSSSPSSSTPIWPPSSSSSSLPLPRQTSSQTTSFNGNPISKLVSKEFFVSTTSTLTTTMEKDDVISSFTEDISCLTDNKAKAVRVNTLKKLSSFQRLWQKMNKSKKKGTKKSKKKNRHSPSPQPTVIVVPSSKTTTADKISSVSSVPTTAESKKKKSVISSLFGVGGGNNSKDGFTFDDFEQKRIDLNEIDIAKWEYYLNDDEFMKQFGGVTKDEFYQLPKWKRDIQKRQVRVAF